MRRYLADMVNAAAGENALLDLSGLVEILDCEPGEIERTLTQLRVKQLEDDDEPESWPEEAETEWADQDDAAGSEPADTSQEQREAAGSELVRPC
jgi:hypothetical protein